MEQHILPSAQFAADRDRAATVPHALAETTIERFERSFERALANFLGPMDGSPVADQLKWHFGVGCDGGASRGKRLRPQVLFNVAFDEGARFDDAIDAALAIEFLHNYSLVHDDIEDGDVQRRGRETVWARYGLAHGINAGDTVCAVAYLTMLGNSAEAPLERVVASMRVLQAANLAMCVGQSADLDYERAPHVALSAYLSMIDGKTAALFGAACELGALCAGNDAFRARAYGELGRAYGRAFQIRDDMLGTIRDIARRKWSFPVVWALAGPPSAAREAIAARYACLAPLDARDAEIVADALASLGACAAAQAACERQIRHANRVAGRHRLDRGGHIRRLFAKTAVAQTAV